MKWKPENSKKPKAGCKCSKAKILTHKDSANTHLAECVDCGKQWRVETIAQVTPGQIVTREEVKAAGKPSRSSQRSSPRHRRK
jgi:hypothetical protein